MEVVKTGSKVKNIEKRAAGNVTEKAVKSQILPLIVILLKEKTDHDHVMSIREIARELNRRVGYGGGADMYCAENAERSVRRWMEELLEVGYGYEGKSSMFSKAVAEELYRAYGGRVMAEAGGGYWFEPILTAGDIAMINAAIVCNGYLTRKEKEYLMIREATMGSRAFSQNAEKTIGRLPARPRMQRKDPSDDVQMPGNIVLENINILHEALRKKLQIRVVYGMYTEKDGRMVLQTKNEGKQAILNPYGMVFAGGQYYLVVTHKGHTNPTHYRVDRIWNVEPVLVEKEPRNRKQKYQKREEIPKELQEFFCPDDVFNAELYTRRYPLMQYEAWEAEEEEFSFACLRTGMSLAIDYFGRALGVLPLSEKYGLDRDKYVMMTVHAGFQNVRLFCIQYNAVVIPLASDRLVLEVKEALQEAVSRTGLIVKSKKKAR